MKFKTNSIIILSFAAAPVLAIACSGSDAADDVFSNGTNSTNTSSGTSGMGGAGGQGSGSSTSSTSSGSASGSSSSSSGSMGSGGASGTGGSMGSGGSPPVAQIPCGNVTCAPGEVCCNAAPNSGLMDQCGMPGTCPDGTAEVSCNDLEDCPGQMCCGNFQQGVGYTSVACYDQCTNGQIIMCNGHPEICPPGDSCNQSMFLGDGYRFCQ